MGKNRGQRLELAAGAALGAATAGFMWAQNNLLTVTRLTAGGERLPECFNGYKIALVSDLHGKEFPGDLLPVRLAELKPDLIAVTGDLIDRRRTDLEAAERFIRGAIAAAPVCFVPGNHELASRSYHRLCELLLDYRVELLEGRETTLEREGGRIRLLGMPDPCFYGHGRLGERRFEAQLRELAVGGGYKLLLCHRPELLWLYAECGIDLALAGHAHGGQARLPLIGPLIAPHQGIFPRLTEGLYIEVPTELAVSRGLGNSLCPLRLFNYPELALITLRKSGG